MEEEDATNTRQLGVISSSKTRVMLAPSPPAETDPVSRCAQTSLASSFPRKNKNNGEVDFGTATIHTPSAEKVHDCLGRGLEVMSVDRLWASCCLPFPAPHRLPRLVSLPAVTAIALVGDDAAAAAAAASLPEPVIFRP